MPEHEPGIRIDPDGKDWVLHRTEEDGTATSIRLSAENVLSIAEAAPSLQARVTATLPGAAGSHQRTFAVPLAALEVGADAVDYLLLRATLPNGLRQTYSLSSEQAQELSDLILERLAMIRSANPTRQ